MLVAYALRFAGLKCMLPSFASIVELETKHDSKLSAWLGTNNGLYYKAQ